MSGGHSTRTWWWGVGGVAGFVGLWEAACVVFRVPAYVLPSPVATLQTLVADAALLSHHAGTTVVESILGLALAFAVGMAMAVVMTASRAARGLLYPSLVLSQAVPLIAIAPLILIWFGRTYSG